MTWEALYEQVDRKVANQDCKGRLSKGLLLSPLEGGDFASEKMCVVGCHRSMINHTSPAQTEWVVGLHCDEQ